MNATLHSLEIPYIDPICAVFPFIEEPFTIFLDSALTDNNLGRYSFIGVDPFLTLSSKNGEVRLNDQVFNGNPFEILQEQLEKYPLHHNVDLPPFQTGAAGYFAYDLNHHLEKLPIPGEDDMGFPDLMLGFYDMILAFDHVQHRTWILSSGYPEQESNNRNARAQARIQEMQDMLKTIPEDIPRPVYPETPQPLTSNFSRDEYELAVQKVIDYIYDGDIFQANLTQRFVTQLASDDTPFALYQRLRKINPAPFAAYLNFNDTVIASASPERFLKLSGNQVETRPIKGTRPRGTTSVEDQALAQELLESEKDNAENVMIVDLLRNDLSRVCLPHSINTPEICILESYATVHHLVSTVIGQLKPEVNVIDLLKATIPGGSITGAPKIRAMEIIAELEPSWRGPYCGNIGYISFSGDMDTSIVIRTYAIKNDQITFQAGGGIVADSDPAAEYEETFDKARALIHALGIEERVKA